MEKKTANMTLDAEGFRVQETTHAPGQIYQLIGKAIGMIGAIGKDNVNQQQKFRYRGIDQVYNALNPVMAELGIFFCPEVLDMRREDRVTKNGTALTYTILTIRFTAFAPDGSNVSLTVMGEGMDSGDKGCNKAMSVAMKYAMFQLFCIPTEEMKDPDADVYEDVMPKGHTVQNANVRPQDAAQQASVSAVDKIPAPQAKAPETAPAQQETPGAYIKRRIAEFTAKNKDFNFLACRQALIDAKIVEDVPSAIIRMPQAVDLMDAIDKNFFTKVS